MPAPIMPSPSRPPPKRRRPRVFWTVDPALLDALRQRAKRRGMREVRAVEEALRAWVDGVEGGERAA